MTAVQSKGPDAGRGPRGPICPCEHFDLIAETSTGG